MTDISVIIPVYNAEKFIAKCLDTVLCQTKKEFEIIAIDDGSKDASLEILYQYQKRYPDIIKVLSQDNQGLSVTRNNGIKTAKGNYLIFIDSDDTIAPDMLEELYLKTIEGNFDVVACDVDCIYPNKSIKINSGIQKDYSTLSLEDKKSLFFGIYPIVCNKIYKRELFDSEELLFEPKLWFEDVLFFHKLIPNIKNIGVIKKSFYRYLQNSNSITYTYSDKLSDINTVLNKIVEYYKSKDLYETYRDELEYMYARYMLATYIKRLAKAKDFSRFKEGIQFALESLKTNFPEYKKNPYLKKSAKGIYLKHFNPLLAYMIYFVEKNRMN